MNAEDDLVGFDMPSVTLESEWIITIDTLTGGVGPVLEALERDLAIVQVPTTVARM